MDVTLVYWRETRKHVSIIMAPLLKDWYSPEHEASPKILGRQQRNSSLTGSQSRHRPYSKHIFLTRSLCCFSNNPTRRVEGYPIINKTAYRNGEVYKGFLSPKYHMWSQNILFIPFPDTSPTHTGSRKKYMAACWPRILSGVPHQLEESSSDLEPNTGP